MKKRILAVISLTTILFACSSMPQPLKDMDKLCENTLTKLDTVSSFASLRKVNWDFSLSMDEIFSTLELNMEDQDVKKYYEEVMYRLDSVQVRFGDLEKKYSPNFQ